MTEFLTGHLALLARLEVVIKYSFKDRTLLRQALTHKSFSNENQALGLGDNEALEFLGDSILGFVISHHLFREFPDFAEGDLSRLKSFLVSGTQLFYIARDLDLGEFLLLGRGETKTRGHDKKNILSDTLEALIAAIYLDSGLRSARSFILRIYRQRFADLNQNELRFHDYKTRLQERLAEKQEPGPVYLTTGEEGPDHRKTFHVQVKIGETVWGKGSGNSKKEAHQIAARETLRLMAEKDASPESRSSR